MHRARLATGLAVALLGSCTRERPPPIDAGSLGLDLAFVIDADTRGHPVETYPPFGEAAPDAAPLVLSVGETGRRLFILGFDRDALRSLEGLDRSRAGTSALSIAVPPRGLVLRRTEAGAVHDRAVPAFAEVLEVYPDGSVDTAREDARGELLGALVLTVPVVGCDQWPAGPPRPFGAKPYVLEDAARDGDRTLHQIVRLEPDRVLAMTRESVVLIRRGEPWVRTADNYFPSSTGGTDDPRFSAVAVSSALAGGGPRQVTIVGSEGPETSEHGRIWELEVDERGLRFVRSSSAGEELNDVLADGSGVVVIVGNRGALLTRGPRDATFTIRPPPDPTNLLPELDFGRVIATNDPLAPHLVAGRTRLYRGDAVLGSWESDEFFSLYGRPIQVDAVAPVSSAAGAETWLAGDRIVGVRRAGQDWVRVEPDYSAAELTPCLKPGTTVPDQVRDLAVVGPWAFVAIECNALVRLRRYDGCSSFIAVPAGAPIAGDNRIRTLLPGTPFMLGGDLGLLMELDTEP